MKKVAAVGILALAAGSSAAQVAVDFSPSVINLNIGESALVAVNVTGVPAPGLAAFQFDLTFDAVLVDVLNPNEAHRGSIAPFAPLGNNPSCTTVRGTGTCNDPDWFLITTTRSTLGTDTIDNVNGAVVVAYGTHGAPVPPTGNGTVALIEVYGAWDGTVAVNLANVILADDQEPPGTFATAPGSLTVVVGTGVANLPPLLTPIGNRAVYEELPLSIPIASSDPDGNGIALSATGLPAFCMLTDNGDGSGAIDCTPVTGDAGSYPVTVMVTDDGGPNLTTAEMLTITVDPTSCTDGDGDGFGAPGHASCPEGLVVDCDDTDAAVRPDAVELCRNGLDDDCNSSTDGADGICPASMCLLIALGAPASDPDIDFQAAAQCPVPGSLARTVDVIWGNLADVRVDTGEIKVGAINQLVCTDTNDAQAFDNLRPDPGQVDFFLVRETGVSDYGSSSATLPRTPDTGDCP